jgi:hypothetical protein
MAVIEIAKIQVRRGQEGITGVPRLDPGEFGWAEDTQHLYIGKRVSEGASSDDNTRILTDKDLANIFELINFGPGSNAHDGSATYRYRNDPAHTFDKFASTTTTIGRKLDNWVSLTDFIGPEDPLYGGRDITLLLRTAITNLYANPNLSTTDTSRTLMIPAGHFVVSGNIDLPPNAQLVGQGIDTTTIVSTSADQHVFRTIDGLGVAYNGMMQTSAGRSSGVKITDMTIAYPAGNNNDVSLVSLDNSYSPLIKNVKFTTIDANLSSPAFVSTGSAVQIRGNLGSDEGTLVANNSTVEGCIIENMRVGVIGEGLILRNTLRNNIFEYLQQGVRLQTPDPIFHTGYIPMNTLINGNNFRFVLNDAVHVTTSSNQQQSFVVCSENVYHYVGNDGMIPDDLVDRPTGAILTFNSPANLSSNDHFNRAELFTVADPTYYNPLVSGNCRINNPSTKNFDSQAGLTNMSFLTLPLTDGDQLVYIDYQLKSNNTSRSGKLTVNITKDGYASVNDAYAYSESFLDESTLFVFSTNLDRSKYNVDWSSPSYQGDANYVSITLSNFTTNTNATLSYSVDLLLN